VGVLSSVMVNHILSNTMLGDDIISRYKLFRVIG
jgi:hypothetical protein